MDKEETFNFRAELMSDSRIVERLNEGAEDKNIFNALKYIDKIIDLKGLGRGIGNQIQIVIPGLNDKPFEVDETRIKDDRKSIEEFLFE